MSTIDLDSNRGKGHNAYICPVVRYSGQKDMDRCKFPKPKLGQEGLAHKKKFFKGEVEISGFSDGWYYYNEASFQGHMRDGLVKIKSGEVVENLGTIEELMILTAEKFFPSLCPLVGTEKQIKWAEIIRAKKMLLLWEKGYERDIYGSLPCEAKWWIELKPGELTARIKALHSLEAALDAKS